MPACAGLESSDLEPGDDCAQRWKVAGNDTAKKRTAGFGLLGQPAIDNEPELLLVYRLQSHHTIAFGPNNLGYARALASWIRPALGLRYCDCQCDRRLGNTEPVGAGN